VRPRHQELDGKEFDYDNPPAEGLPGQPVGCRCFAESVIPDELVELVGVAQIIEE